MYPRTEQLNVGVMDGRFFSVAVEIIAKQVGRRWKGQVSHVPWIKVIDMRINSYFLTIYTNS
jgi:hypothetical protein